MCIEYNECHYSGMYNINVKRIFVITEIMHMTPSPLLLLLLLKKIFFFILKWDPHVTFFPFLSVSAPKQIIWFRFQFHLSYLNILYIFTIFRVFFS